MSIRIIDPGPFTTVQDLGRIGYQNLGVSVSGAMDQRSLIIANILLDNDDNEAVLEATLKGPTLEFTADTCIAVTGGNLWPVLSGHKVPMYQAVPVRAGQVLSFDLAESGSRAYIAFAGGLDLPLSMGSRSTYAKAKIGGLNGRKLQEGDVIGFRAPKATLPLMEKRIAFTENFSAKESVIRVILGPQEDAFTPEGIETFLTGTYTVTPKTDRVGCQLAGPSIQHVKDGNIISDGISNGAVQVPSDGAPIVILADRQTVGGYTKIANVITVDLPRMGQMKMNDRIRFQAVDIDYAQDLLIEQVAYLRHIRDKLSRGLYPR